MEFNVLSVLVVGLILGIKHATEPDHVIAVSTIASQTKRLSMSSLTGIFWGIGHTLTLLIVGMIIIGLKQEIPERLALALEFCVGIMLVYLGVSGFRKVKEVVSHTHSVRGFHMKSMLIGLMHGLAGSAAMVLLTMSTVESTSEAFMFILLFGCGTIAGMLGFTTLLGLPFVWAASRGRMYTLLARAAAVVSVVYGLYYMYDVGIAEGLFVM